MGIVTKSMFLCSMPPLDFVRKYKEAYLYVAVDEERWDCELPNTEAVTFDKYIACRSEESCNDPEVLKHEYAHVKRISKEGGELVFRPKLLFSMACAFIATGNTQNNRYEREARIAEK